MDYWQGLAAEYGESVRLMRDKLKALDDLITELRWGNAATASRDYGRGVAYVLDKVTEVLDG